MKCIANHEPAPAAIVDWCQQSRKTLCDAEHPAFPLISMIARLVNLYSKISSTYYANVEAVYGELIALEVEFEQWTVRLPDNWKFYVETSLEDYSSTGTVFNLQHHVYRDLWAGRVWNNYRWARTFVNELIVIHISRQNSITVDESLQQKRSLCVISQMANDICTSVSSQFRRHTTINAKLNGSTPVRTPTGNIPQKLNSDIYML